MPVTLWRGRISGITNIFDYQWVISIWISSKDLMQLWKKIFIKWNFQLFFPGRISSMGCSTGWRVYAKCQVPWKNSNKKGQFGDSFPPPFQLAPVCLLKGSRCLPHLVVSSTSLTEDKLGFWNGLFLFFDLIYGLPFCEKTTNIARDAPCFFSVTSTTSPRQNIFLLAMYVHKYFCSDNSVVCLNKNMYIFNSVLGYITNTSSR